MLHAQQHASQPPSARGGFSSCSRRRRRRRRALSQLRLPAGLPAICAPGDAPPQSASAAGKLSVRPCGVSGDVFWLGPPFLPAAALAAPPPPPPPPFML